MRFGTALNLASAAAGAIGTMLLFSGSFAYEQLGGYANQALVDKVRARNKRRQTSQRIGLCLLLLSFLLQGAGAVVAAPSIVGDLIELHSKLDGMCRGWPGSDPHTDEACDAREKTSASSARGAGAKLIDISVPPIIVDAPGLTWVRNTHADVLG